MCKKFGENYTTGLERPNLFKSEIDVILTNLLCSSRLRRILPWEVRKNLKSKSFWLR